MKTTKPLQIAAFLAFALMAVAGLAGQNSSQISPQASDPSDTIRIDFLSGRVEFRGAATSDWQPLRTSTTLTLHSDVRLHPGANLELLRAGRRYGFRLPGVYNLAELLQREAASASLPFGAGIPGAVPDNLGARARTAAGGVRASEAVDTGTNALPTPRNLIDAGLLALYDGLYTEALGRFSEAFDFATDTVEMWESLYYTGYTQLLQGRSDDAVETFAFLAELEFPSGPRAVADYHIPFTLTYAQALVETGDGTAALGVLGTFNEQQATVEQRQYHRYFRGLAQMILGQTPQARASLEQAASLAPGSEIARQARSLLELAGP